MVARSPILGGEVCDLAGAQQVFVVFNGPLLLIRSQHYVPIEAFKVRSEVKVWNVWQPLEGTTRCREPISHVCTPVLGMLARVKRVCHIYICM